MEKESAVPIPVCKAAGRPKASDVEARLHNLLCTAGALFLEHGYSKVSLETIAREAHVAVRTIYVKFGGKAGLFSAVLARNRDLHFNLRGMETDTRPLKEIVDEFALRFLELITAPAPLRIQRIVIAESADDPELAQTYFNTGPRQVRDMLERFFARPDIRAQLRDDVELDVIPSHLLNCAMGDQFSRYLIDPEMEERSETERKLAQRLTLFYRSVLRAP